MTKRKSADELATSRKRRQAFTVPKDAATKAAVRRNADSPLLRLPREIKDQIYTYVLGDQVLHINRLVHGGHSNIEDDYCERPGHCSERDTLRTEIYDRNEILPPPTIEHVSYDRPQRGRRQYGVIVGSDDHRKTNELYDLDSDTPKLQFADSLGVLRACRQLYLESNPLLWSTNVFSFHDIDPLRDFFGPN